MVAGRRLRHFSWLTQNIQLKHIVIAIRRNVSNAETNWLGNREYGYGRHHR